MWYIYLIFWASKINLLLLDYSTISREVTSVLESLDTLIPIIKSLYSSKLNCMSKKRNDFELEYLRDVLKELKYSKF